MTVLERRLSEDNERLERENRALRARIDYLLRKLHGRSSEKLDSKQLLLELAELTDELERRESAPSEPEPERASPPREPRKGHGRRRLPDSMVERVVYIDPEEVKADPQAYREIGRETSERLDIIPPTLLKIVQIRRKFVRLADEAAAPLIAPLPPCAVEKGLPTARLLAWVCVSKFCDHMPLHRQEKSFRRLGCAVSRKTMADWMGSIEFWLAGLVELMRLQLLRGNYIQADETPIKYMDEDVARKRCGEGWLWALSSPGGDVVFHWAVTRSHAVATSLLDGYQGLLQCDGYQAYEKLEGATRIACMAHIRRKFESARNEDVQLAAFVLLSIGKLYAVEARLRRSKSSPKLRDALRQSESRMVFERLGKALRKRQIRHLPKSEMGKAIGYALGQWEAMSRYLRYGEAEIDNNLMENAIRPSAIGKKNWLFIGHPKAGSRSAVIYSIIVSCERRGINPFEYLTDVLDRLPATKNSEQWKLTPENWAKYRNVKSES